MSTENIHPKKDPEKYMEKLLTDPYLNAIRAKYGYAVTCHKAQGGEWDNVFLIIEKAMFHPEIKAQLFKMDLYCYFEAV
jgi:hypothetical protein